MKNNKIVKKIKYFSKKSWNKFTFWFSEKEHPRSVLNKKVFFYDLLTFIGLVLIFLIVNSNVEQLNKIVLLIIYFGSALRLVLLYFILRKIWQLAINLQYFFRGLNHGTKSLFAIAIVLLLFYAYQNQNDVVNSITNAYEKVEFQKLNPINMNLNLSSIKLDDIKKNNILGSCPQIDVKMNENRYLGFNIKGISYDGWTIKGDATCRKGTKEGENLNRYYCGGYTFFMGLGDVNAYVEKTIISNNGNIGKTYKYVIWNIYDENKNFVETRCIGNPDEFDKKQAEAFYNEMLKWN